MAQGFKTGGRKAGTPNRKTTEIMDLLAAHNCDPVEGVIKIAQDENNSPELRGKMFATLLEYCYPKRKAVELTTDQSNEIVVTWQPPQPAPYKNCEREPNQ